MFGIPSKKTINKLESQIAELQKKSLAPTTDEIISVSIPLYNLSKKEDVAKALLEVPELSSIIKYMSSSFSFGTFNILKDETEIENDILKLLKKPNPFQSETEFIQSFFENIITYGVSYIYVNSKGLPEFAKGLSVLGSNKVSPYVGDISNIQLLEATDLKKTIKCFEYFSDTKKIKINTENVIIVTANTSLSLRNKRLNYLSPLKPLEKVLKVTPAMYDSMQNLMNNGGMKGFVSNESLGEFGSMPITPEEKKDIHKAFRNYGSKSGQHDIAFVNTKVNYVPITSRIKDMLLPEQQNMIKTIIADVMGFDTAILNSNNANKYKSTDYQEARKSMYKEKLFPIADALTNSLSNYFYKFSDEKIILNYDGLDVFSVDEKTKVEKIEIESNLIMNLNKSVSLGEMTRDNAISFLELSGYEIEDAQNLIQ